MAAEDDLTRPLGQSAARRPARRSIRAAAGIGVLALAAGGAYLFVDLTETAPEPGPSTVVAIDRTVETGTVDAGTPGLVEVAPDGALTDIGRVVIHDPSRPGAMQLAALPDPDLLEVGPYGPLPVTSTDGVRPLDAYARPASADSGADRIAIVIGGIGINDQSTASAIRDLPGAVTLAVAPYSDDLEGTVQEARRNGHELILQLPMEPFNYPANDPGPQTLTIAGGAAVNIDNLHWLMSRTTNYVGVANYLGARFTGDADALSPVLEEVGRRGLLYLDDGSSPRSQAPELARGLAPFVRADLTLDVDLNAGAIDLRLEQLQAIARERGFAIAVATAFPVTIDRVAAFAERAHERGIELVPVSALVLSGRS